LCAHLMQLFPFSGVCVCVCASAPSAARNRLIIGNATGDSRFFLTSVLVLRCSLSLCVSLLSFLLDLSLAVVGLLLVSEVGGERESIN
jgi:hypothetical protein